MSNRVLLHHVEIPMTEPFRISSGTVSTKESIVVEIELEGVVGYGEASPMSGAFYSLDTPDSTFSFLEDFLIPEAIEGRLFDSERFDDRYHYFDADPFARTGVEGALWDLDAQKNGVSFPQRLGAKLHPIESGLAVGIYPSIEELLEAVEKYLVDGYKRVKIKIEPGWDRKPLQAMRDRFGPDLRFMVDANAAYRREHFSILESLDEFDLEMIEQPLATEDLTGHADLQARISTPLCIDESAKDPTAVQRAIDMKACRVVNLKIQRLGGLLQAKRTYDVCEENGVPCWMGTMPELGLAALHALYHGLLPNCRYPTDVEASARWFEAEIVDPPITVKNGLIEIPEEHRERPNINLDIVDRYTKRMETISF